MSKLKMRIVKMIDLAISAEKIGNEHESAAAAYRVGVVAHHADVSLTIVWDWVPELHSTAAQGVWSYIVDGWHDASEEG